MTVLRATAKAVATAVPMAELARLGLPTLAAALGLAVMVLIVVCWVLASDARCERMSKILRAWRGTATHPPEQ